LNFDVECIDILDGGAEGPVPNIFNEIDADGDRKLTYEEVEAWFKGRGTEKVPEGLWEKEDKNEDKFISWEEFSGPKGAKEEL
jgi:hypothetical protein